MTVENNNQINQNLASFIFNRLSKSDLKKYLFYIKMVLKEKTLYITSAFEMNNEIKEKLENSFKDKKTIFSVDATLGAGLIIKNGDNVIDTSIKGTINQVVKTLKSEL